MVRVRKIVAAVILIIAWAFYVASNATSSWGAYTYSISVYSYSSTVGLWKYCSGTVCVDFGISCTSLTSSCATLMPARAFLTAACVVAPLVATLLITVAVLPNPPKPLVICSILLTVGLMILGSIGVGLGIVFTILGTTYAIAASAFVGIVGCGLNLIAIPVVASMNT